MNNNAYYNMYEKMLSNKYELPHSALKGKDISHLRLIDVYRDIELEKTNIDENMIKSDDKKLVSLRKFF